MKILVQPFKTPYQSAPFNEISVNDFEPAIDELIKSAEKEIELVADNPDEPSWENTVLALEKNGAQLDRVTEILFNLNHAETSSDLQKIAMSVSPKLSAYSSRMMMNPKLFGRIKSLYTSLILTDSASTPMGEKLSEEDRTLLTNYYDGFVRNGAKLNGVKKKRFAEIKEELSKLTLQFGDHVLAETNGFFLHLIDKEDLVGLPDFVLEEAAQEARTRELDGWVFTLHQPSLGPFLKYSTRRDLRKKLFMAYSFRANQDNEFNNKSLIVKIVNLRLELAQLLGYKNYAGFVLKKRMASHPAKVNQFIEELHLASRPFAQKEYQEVENFARKTGHQGPVERWDWAFYSEGLRKQNFDISDEIVKPFFELGKVTEEILGLAAQLYGLKFNLNSEIQVYHQDVAVYEVLDEQGKFLSLLYLDFFPRPGKQGGAWMTDFKGQETLRGKDSRPHISIVCNFTKPTKSKPSLLTFDEVNTFLHEFGHALHGMLSRCTYPSLSGTNVYRDFVELPSQIMENWLTEKEWLDLVAIHYQTGKKMPEDLIQRLIDACNFQAGYLSERQLSFGMNDMAWHSITEPFVGNVTDFERQGMAPTELFPEVPGYTMSTAFSHIFSGGYAAGYYGYKWAEVLDADAFSVFKEKAIFNKEVAASFRKNILERGGSEHPMTLYKKFRGKEPEVKGLLERSGLVKA